MSLVLQDGICITPQALIFPLLILAPQAVVPSVTEHDCAGAMRNPCGATPRAAGSTCPILVL